MNVLDKIVQARNLSKAIGATKRLLSERGESNGASMAQEVLSNYHLLNEEQRASFYVTLAQKYNPDPKEVVGAAQAYAADPSAQNLIWLTKVSEPPRQELLRRLNRAKGGTGAIVEMRSQLLKLLDKKPELAALDFDMRHLLTSWFNPGFLTMHQVDWKSPAHILEKLIQHEAVHAIDGWDDLRRRLQPDRRCFAFFHPQLPDEPLIFVEVALLTEVPEAVGPLVDKKAEPLENVNYKVAVFYSISNCQPGLRGISLGNFLIKRVAEYLKQEIPSLKTFVTLSPIPGFIDWLIAGAKLGEGTVKTGIQEKVQELLEDLDLKSQSWAERLSAGWHPSKASELEKETLMSLCAMYLMYFSPHRGGNSVAKFHLGNGAKLYRINWAGDLSKKGLRQSAGIMVNYLYDLERVEVNHEKFVNGEVIYSRNLSKWV